MDKYPQRYADVLSDVPKKLRRHESEHERARETTEAASAEEATHKNNSNTEREAANKSRLLAEKEVANKSRSLADKEVVKKRLDVEHLKEMANKARSEAAVGKLRKTGETREDDEVAPSLPQVNEIPQPASESLPPPSKTETTDEHVAENDKTIPSAADTIDEAMMKTATALAADREKTLESLKKLLSNELQTGKESDSSSSSKSSRKARKSASSSSSSGSSSDSSRR